MGGGSLSSSSSDALVPTIPNATVPVGKSTGGTGARKLAVPDVYRAVVDPDAATWAAPIILVLPVMRPMDQATVYSHFV